MTKKKEFIDLSISAMDTDLKNFGIAQLDIDFLYKQHGFYLVYSLNKALGSAYEFFTINSQLPKSPTSISSKYRHSELIKTLLLSASQFDALHPSELSGILQKSKHIIEPNELFNLPVLLRKIAKSSYEASKDINQPSPDSQTQLDKAENEFIDQLIVIYENGTGKKATRGWKNNSNRDNSVKGEVNSPVIRFCCDVFNILNLQIKVTRIDSYLRNNPQDK